MCKLYVDSEGSINYEYVSEDDESESLFLNVHYGGLGSAMLRAAAAALVRGGEPGGRVGLGFLGLEGGGS